MSGKEIVPIDEISISAELSENGIKAGVKSRALSAFDRLIGSTIDLAGVPIEGLRDRMRMRNEVREALIRAEGDAALKRLDADSSSGAALLDSFLAGERRKATNREAIAIEFVDRIRIEDGVDEDVPGAIDPDWMNVFASHAENASSERLQSLWASILAGQVRKPGAFSLSTLRFVSELDQDIALLFQKYLGPIFFGQFLLKPEEIKGDRLIDLTFLEEVGLLSEVNGSLTVDIENSGDGFWYYPSGELLLKVKLRETTKLKLIKLSRVGREIASILPKVGDETVLTDLFKAIDSRSEAAEICTIIQRLADGMVRHTPSKKLKG